MLKDKSINILINNKINRQKEQILWNINQKLKQEVISDLDKITNIIKPKAWELTNNNFKDNEV